jgi:3-methyladenine DNA glycosylase/8-oxoguanine DNA glycosylase
MVNSAMARAIQFTSRAFDFELLVRSHGWAWLAPFEWDESSQTLSRPLHMPDAGHVMARIRCTAADGSRSRVRVNFATPVDSPARTLLGAQVRRMLSLDQDLSEFHATCSGDALLDFVARTGAGRILRAPTVFEDVIKTVCTVNCDWRNTTRMSAALCDLGGGNFPVPKLLLRYTEPKLARVVPLGYRARTVLDIARRSDAGKLPLDEWAAAGDWERVAALLDVIWGIGPYAAAHIRMLLGDFSTIPVDGEVLKYLRGVHFNGRPISPKKAVEPYAHHGRFQFLAFKFGRIARKLHYVRNTIEGEIVARAIPPMAAQTPARYATKKIRRKGKSTRPSARGR